MRLTDDLGCGTTLRGGPLSRIPRACRTFRSDAISLPAPEDGIAPGALDMAMIRVQPPAPGAADSTGQWADSDWFRQWEQLAYARLEAAPELAA
jgi:hypothetical protein